MTKKFLFLFLLFGCSGCTSLPKSALEINYAQAKKIKAGVSRQAVLDIVGPPPFKTNEDGIERWSYSFPYSHKGHKIYQIPRLEILFDQKTNLTDNIIFYFYDELGDKVSLEDLKKSYSDHIFKEAHSFAIPPGHMYSFYHHLIDTQRGLKIEFAPPQRNRVSSINWFQPGPGNYGLSLQKREASREVGGKSSR